MSDFTFTFHVHALKKEMATHSSVLAWGIPEKHLFLLHYYAKAFVWITINCGKFFKRGEYQTILLASCKTCMQIKKQS